MVSGIHLNATQCGPLRGPPREIQKRHSTRFSFGAKTSIRQKRFNDIVALTIVYYSRRPNHQNATMTVKEVLQSLVDDNMVDCERLGTSNYYWAFPSKALHTRELKLEELNKQVSEAKQRQISLQDAIGKAKEGRQDTKERSAMLKELQALKDERAQLQTELDKYKDCDPQVVEQMRKSNMVAKEAVSRWTDNVFAIKSWTKKKFAFDDSRINKAFGIPEDFDYLD
ncbi:meiotic nuclear division protein 1 homolog isoform X1 [Hippocampus zosterae]|uniref:meiotic nuclear division protein 1 homolog isoform X1 n=1 Tax=Hippocampus zosterae TaxID=109293 RepID=UPI00223E0727|nr:meiotic nuclear division protein 1 homolog isoform X1 [Hippocampus zosterae]